MLFRFSRTLEGVERELPEALPAKKSDEGEDPAAKAKAEANLIPRTILGGCFSADGRQMALCDDRKQLTLWNCGDWSLVKQWTLQRRANKVAFNADSSEIFIAGKGPFINDVTQEEVVGGLSGAKPQMFSNNI